MSDNLNSVDTHTPNTSTTVGDKTGTVNTIQNPAVPDQKDPKEDSLSPKFAALAKKERYARMLSQKAKAREAEIVRREQAILDRERMWDEEWKKTPLDALKKRGITYEDLTQAALNDGKFNPDVEIKSVKDEIQRLREEQAEKERKTKEAMELAQKQQEQEIVDAFKENISSHLEQNLEKYELTKLFDASDLVFQTVEEYFERNQKVLSIDEACQLVETYLESEIDRTAKESKKFKSKFLTPQQKQDQEKREGTSSVTLNNQMNSSSAPSLLPKATEDERMKRALAALG